MEKLVFIEKANNGYVVKTRIVSKELPKELEDSFLKFFQMSGMYEKYEEQKEEELRRFIRMIRFNNEFSEESSYVFSNLESVFDFIREFMNDLKGGINV